MQHRKFSIKHIAAQAAVSAATVDRVLNNRPGVRAYTVQRVLNAIDELEQLSGTVKMNGRKNYIDLVLHGPDCYSDLVEKTVLEVLPTLKPLNINPRFHRFESSDVSEVADAISFIANSETDGLIVKAADDFRIREAIDRAYCEDIPTVTFCTDVRYSKRIGFVGVDHFSAGQSAAYLVGKWCRQTEPLTVLVYISNFNFLNEAEREMGFRQIIRQSFPHVHINTLSGGWGVADETYKLVDEYLINGGNATLVYSIGGPNQSILDAFEKHGKPIDLFVGHDLDEANRLLLKQNRLDAVIGNNLLCDARTALLKVLEHHKISVSGTAVPQSNISIFTPYNC